MELYVAPLKFEGFRMENGKVSFDSISSLGDKAGNTILQKLSNSDFSDERTNIESNLDRMFPKNLYIPAIDDIENILEDVQETMQGELPTTEKDTTEKIVEDTNNVAMKYVNADGEGFCIGTQEAYFKTAGKVVNVRYKEGEIINISFVVDKPRETLSIYLNGILSGAVNLNGIRAIRMENIPFLVNSEYCDFDLYKLRVYHIALTMPEVIHNYISDLKSITLYDENKLTEDNDDFKLSYEKLLAYNVAHPDAPSMPYVVIDSTATPNDQDLPHFKGGNKKVRIEFTNPTADYLLNQGLISEYQYYTHCPSYVADGVDINVQGTSSMKYPRRNFKTKFKDAGTS